MLFFIDESGQTGDVGKHNVIKDGAAQPIFTLAAIHISSHRKDDIGKKIIQLKKKHGVQAEFLKSITLWEKNDLFTYELLKYLVRTQAGFFIEIVDKKHYIVRNLVVFFLLYGRLMNNDSFKEYCFSDLRIHPHQLMMKIEDKINVISSSELLLSYSESVKAPTYNNLMNTFNILQTGLGELGDDKIDKIIVNIFWDAKESLERSINNTTAFNDFVPPFDVSKKNIDKNFAFVCNLTSFSNLYGRLNAFIPDPEEPLDIIHDVQDQFDTLLDEYSAVIRNSKEDLQNVLPSYSPLDYVSERDFSLNFKDDEVHIELQIADLVAGYMMRIVRNISTGSEINQHQRKIARLIINQSKKNEILGVNYVAPTSLIKRIKRLKK